MPRLAKAELGEHRSWLSEWHTPAEMAAYVAAVQKAMRSADFFRQGGIEFLRDAWLAAEFGVHRQSSLVRLVPEHERWPDFQALTGDITEDVECAEADVPGRRRGQEYRVVDTYVNGEQFKVEHDPVEDWIKRADQVPTALAEVINRKIRERKGGDSEPGRYPANLDKTRRLMFMFCS